MAGTSPGRTVIDIKGTVRKHDVLYEKLLAVHTLSGVILWDNGKGTVLKVMSAWYFPTRLEIPPDRSPLPLEIMKATFQLIVLCGYVYSHTMMFLVIMLNAVFN